MTDQLAEGFGGGLRARMSPMAQRRHAEEERREAREAAEQRRQRQIAAEEWETRQIAASLVLAEDRGEVPTRQERMNGIGRTKAKALAFYSAQADAEDARLAARARRVLQQLGAEEIASWQADNTPRHVEDDQADAAEQATRDETSRKLYKRLDERAARRRAADESRYQASLARRTR